MRSSLKQQSYRISVHLPRTVAKNMLVEGRVILGWPTVLFASMKSSDRWQYNLKVKDSLFSIIEEKESLVLQ